MAIRKIGSNQLLKGCTQLTQYSGVVNNLIDQKYYFFSTAFATVLDFRQICIKIGNLNKSRYALRRKWQANRLPYRTARRQKRFTCAISAGLRRDGKMVLPHGSKAAATVVR